MDGMHFMSGKKTHQYDQKIPSELISDVSEVRDELNAYKEETNDRLLSINHDTQCTKFHIHRIEHMCEEYNDEFKNLIKLLYKFLRSPLMRFLNFFGCWFIYGYDESIYLNTWDNREFGKVPFFTRVKRWVKNNKQNS